MTPFSFNGEWSFLFHLQAFEGFIIVDGDYSSLDTTQKGNGVVNIEILNYKDETNNSPSKEQITAINYLIQHQESIVLILLEAVQNSYAEIKKDYKKNYAEGYIDWVVNFPDCQKLEDYKQTFAVDSIHIHEDSEDGCASIGFECGCIWDEEHGMGVFMHRNTIVSFGQSDVAF